MFFQNKQNYFTQITIFIRSTIFAVYSLVSITLYSIIICCAWPFPVHYRHILIRFFLRLYMRMLKIICRIDCQVEGLENIPVGRNGIVMCKHQSTWETFFLPTLFHDPAPIAKHELLWVPFFGWALAASDPIAINRGQKGAAQQQILSKGKKILAAGRWVIFFPEGTRVPYGKVGLYKLGGARLAAATGYPIVPIAHNAGLYWPRRRFLKQPGTIRIVIGPMIESTGRKPEEILNLTKDWIETTMTRITGLVNKPTG